MVTVDPQDPRTVLQARGLRPKKKYGQNFLVDDGAADRIARLALGETQHARIVEIGAGTGSLTQALVSRGGDVTAIEIDPELIAVLRGREELAAVDIVTADALAFNYAEYAARGVWRVAGNLPYNIATPLIIGFCEMERPPETVTVMIQKDVADRLAARPGTSAYGSLSIAVQYAMTVEPAFTLGPSAFYPPPKVDSTVVQLEARAEPPVRPKSIERFRKVVRAAFAYRRKTFANSLALALKYDRETLVRQLREIGLDDMVRGEALSMADFARISDGLVDPA